MLKAIVTNVNILMDKDSKTPSLKNLQGLIWLHGYQTGEIVAHVYPDVINALPRWRSQGVKIYIYSSGSRAAQRLLFQYSVGGDLRQFILGHFDTSSGHKRQQASYKEISLSLGVDSSEVLFATDVLEEAEAATEAGMSSVLLLREGNKVLPTDHGFMVASSFDELDSVLNS